MRTVFTYKTIFLFAVMTFSSACTHKTYDKMKFQTNPPEINGDISDWGENLRYYDNKSMLFYEIRNDSKNIYIAIGTNNDRTIASFLRNGIKIDVDTLKSMNYPASISFPVLEKHMPPSADRPGDKNESLEMQRPELPAISSYQMKIERFGPYYDTLINESNTIGFSAGINRKKNELLSSEIAIPLSTFYRHGLSTADTLKPLFFKLSIEQPSFSEMPPDGHNSRNPGRPCNMPQGSPVRGMNERPQGNPENQHGNGPGNGIPGQMEKMPQGAKIKLILLPSIN